MKEIIAISGFVIFVIVAIYFFIKRNRYVGTTFLIFAVVSGYVIVNYDVITKLSGLGMEIERAKEAKIELITIKEEALEDLTKEIESQKEEIKKLALKTEKTKEEIERLDLLSHDLIGSYIKTNWLIAQTKNEFGTPRAKKAAEELEKDLNNLLIMIFPDPKERAKWIQNLDKTLPPRP